MSGESWDLDEMIASGQVEGDAVAAQKRLDITARDRGFEFALLNDVEMMIEIATAASKAAEKEERRIAARAAKAQEPKPPRAVLSEEEERARRERERANQRAYRLRRKAAAQAEKEGI